MTRRLTSPDHAGAETAATRLPATQTLALTPRSIQDGIVTLPGPRSCAVLETGAVHLALLHPDELAGLANAYHGFLAGLDFPVQLLVRVQPADPTPYLRWYAAETAGPAGADPALQWLVRGHLAHVARLVAATGPLAHCFYVIVPAPEVSPAVTTWAGRAADAVLRHLPHRSGDRDASTAHEAEPTEARALAAVLATRCGLISAALAPVGVTTHRLDDTELATLWSTCLRPGATATQPLPPQADLAALRPVTVLETPGAQATTATTPHG